MKTDSFEKMQSTTAAFTDRTVKGSGVSSAKNVGSLKGEMNPDVGTKVSPTSHGLKTTGSIQPSEGKRPPQPRPGSKKFQPKSIKELREHSDSVLTDADANAADLGRM